MLGLNKYISLKPFMGSFSFLTIAFICTFYLCINVCLYIHNVSASLLYLPMFLKICIVFEATKNDSNEMLRHTNQPFTTNPATSKENQQTHIIVRHLYRNHHIRLIFSVLLSKRKWQVDDRWTGY